MLALAAWLLRCRKRQLERHASGDLAPGASRELDLLVAVTDLLDQYRRHRKRVREQLARFAAWRQSHDR